MQYKRFIIILLKQRVQQQINIGLFGLFAVYFCYVLARFTFSTDWERTEKTECGVQSLQVYLMTFCTVQFESDLHSIDMGSLFLTLFYIIAISQLCTRW